MSRLALIGLLIACTPTITLAEDGSANDAADKRTSAARVGIVDVNYLFKNHAELKKELLDLKAEGQLVQAKFESEYANLKKKGDELGGIPADSREHKKLEEELVTRKATIEAEIALKRKEFVQREARLYFTTYQQIKKDVAKLAEAKHLIMVQNANLGEIDGDNPEEVGRAITNRLVWYDDAINLTPQLEKLYAASSSPVAAQQATVASIGSKRGTPSK